MKLPDYAPPSALSASVAVSLAPLLVLLTFTLVVWQRLEVDTALACLSACTVWVAVEMHGWQRHVDAYNAEYVAVHLAWRSNATLSVLARQAGVSPETRDFVLGYLDDSRQLRPDAPRL